MTAFPHGRVLARGETCATVPRLLQNFDLLCLVSCFTREQFEPATRVSHLQHHLPPCDQTARQQPGLISLVGRRAMPASRSLLLWSYGVVAVALAFSPEFPRSHIRRRVRTRLRPLASVRENPRSDLFDVLGFHHVELWCGDAAHTSSRWCFGLGMRQVATSSPATGNSQCASICAQSGDIKYLFTAPLQVLCYAQTRTRARARTPTHTTSRRGGLSEQRNWISTSGL